MSDDLNNNQPLPDPDTVPTAHLSITVYANGRTHVEGVINNKLVAYGLLELARDAIQEHHARQKRIEVPKGFELPPHFRKS